MKNSETVLLIITFAVLTACGRERPPGSDTNLADSLSRHMVTLFNSGESARMAELFDEDAVFIMCGWRMCGRDSIRTGMKYLLQHSSDLEFTPVISSVSGGILYMTGLANFNWKNEGYSALARGIMTVIWKKQENGSWKITFEEENHGDLPEK